MYFYYYFDPYNDHLNLHTNSYNISVTHSETRELGVPVFKPGIVTPASANVILTSNYFCRFIGQRTQPVPLNVNLSITGHVGNNEGV